MKNAHCEREAPDIPLREIHFQFARSSGPGGQNVNKVSSKAVLRWNMAASPSAPEDVKRKAAALSTRAA